MSMTREDFDAAMGDTMIVLHVWPNGWQGYHRMEGAHVARLWAHDPECRNGEWRGW